MATFSKPKDIPASALSLRYPVPGLYSRSSECLFDTGGYHAVSILYPWASPQQWPTWESRPGGGINQLPPKSGWTPAGAPRSNSGPSPPGLVPHESLLEFPEMRIVWSQKPAQRLYFAWKFDMVTPLGQYPGRRLQTGIQQDENNVCGELEFWAIFIKIRCFVLKILKYVKTQKTFFFSYCQ